MQVFLMFGITAIASGMVLYWLFRKPKPRRTMEENLRNVESHATAIAARSLAHRATEAPSSPITEHRRVVYAAESPSTRFTSPRSPEYYYAPNYGVTGTGADFDDGLIIGAMIANQQFPESTTSAECAGFSGGDSAGGGASSDWGGSNDSGCSIDSGSSPDYSSSCDSGSSSGGDL